jgi:hypothetical protein
MIWLTWRQHRTEGLVALGVLALLGLFLLITGVAAAHAAQQSGLSSCLAHASTSDLCNTLAQAFEDQYGFLSTAFIPFVLALPALLGALVGGPLVAREVEQRTHLLVWTQSGTRLRWLTMQLALVLGGGLLGAAALMAALIWWYVPFDQLYGHFDTGAFDFFGPSWLAAALLALALGVLASAVVRRTVLAIFLTIALFLSVRVPVEAVLRPAFEPPITVTWPIGQDTPPVTLSAQDWQLARGWIDTHGNLTTEVRARCSAGQTIDQCLKSNGYRGYFLTYQPADRFWTFQWTETVIYLGFALPAIALAGWLVRRKVN